MVVCPDAQIRRLLDAGEDLVAVDRVHFDLGKFFICQLAVLIDDRVRHADLTHVMQQRREIHLLAVFFALARLPGDLNGVHGHAGGMTVGVFVLGVDGVGQRFRRLFKHGVLFLLRLFIGLDFHLPGVLHLARHVLKGKYVEQGRHGDDGHIVQRHAVHKHLKYRCDDRAARKDQQRPPHIPSQVFTVLQYDGHLQQKDRKRDHIADDEARRALIAVHLIKGIV